MSRTGDAVHPPGAVVRGAVEAAAPAGAVEDLLESELRGLGSLPTGLPQRLGKRYAFPTGAWRSLRDLHSSHNPDDDGVSNYD